MEGDQCCWVCEARNQAIEVTFYLAFPAAVFGISLGSLIAFDNFPPLVSNLGVVYMVPLISLVVAVALWLLLQDHLTRYATLIRILIVFVAVTFIMPPAYVALNALLDGSPAMEVPSTIVTKGVSSGKGGGPYLILSLEWNHTRMNKYIRVTNWTLADAEPGDAVRLVVHRGRFAQPWYGEVLFK
jgi:hypothetical protein